MSTIVSTKKTRREFIRESALITAMAALGTSAGTAAASTRLPDGLRWEKAPCRFCGTGCGVLVGISKGRIVAVQGDPENPVNRGLLCAKGYYAGAMLYGHDRLTRPLIRKRGKLKGASWKEAINLIADKIMEDPDKFAIYGSGQWTVTEGYACMKFLKGGLGSNHIDPNARLCMASAVVGFIKTFGTDEPSGCYDDLDECDTIVTWGNNWAETHPVLYSRFMDRKLAASPYQRPKILAIDLGTRFTRTSERADQFLSFTPQTDMAIANCLCHLLVENDAIDKDFVDKNVRFKANDGADITLEQYREFLADYTPEAVAELSGVPAGQLQLLADIFADPERKIVSLWCMGVNQHTRGTAMNNLIYNVHLLSGKIGKPGSTPLSLTGQPSACGTCREVGTLAHALPGGRVVKKEEHRKQVEDVWNTRPGAINPKPGFHTIAMFKALASGDLSSMWVQVTNPAQSIPNLNENLANARERFLVVSDVYPTATTALADVVLPSALWVEKNGVYGNTERRTQQWFKSVEPPGDARDDVWQVLAVARRLYEKGFDGMRDRDGNFLMAIRDENGKEIEAWDWDVYKDFNVDKALYEEYRPLTEMKRKNVAPYDELVQTRGLRWPVVQDDSGEWVETPRRFVEGDDPFVEEGEGVQFYGTADKRAIIWARPYDAPPEMPDEEYPLWLCTGRVLEQWHTGTMTGYVKELQDAMPRAYIELHPKDAKRYGISNGDKVRVTSRRGSVTLTAWMKRAKPREGLVFVPFFDQNLLINQVTLDEYCPMSKEPDYKKCAVKIEKVSVS